MRRILAPLAASASVVALIAILIVAGHGSADRSQHLPSSASSAAPTAPASHSRAHQLLASQALDWYFPASGATYTAGQAFGWTEDKVTARDIDPCLAKARFPQPPFHGSKYLFQLSFPSGEFPDLAQLAAHPGQHVFIGQYPVVHNPTTARMNVFHRAQARCTARYAQPVTRVDKAAAALQSTWITIISAIQTSPSVSATQPAFARCLEAHGVPASYATQTTNASNPLFYGYYAWADSLNQAATSTVLLAAEQRHETRVFVACAGPVVTLVERLQLSRRARFFHSHAGQIGHITYLAEKLGS